MDKVKEYFKGVKAEWGKITWPERKQVIAQTIVVVFIVSVFTAYIYLLDIVFNFVLESAKITG